MESISTETSISFPISETLRQNDFNIEITNISSKKPGTKCKKLQIENFHSIESFSNYKKENWFNQMVEN